MKAYFHVLDDQLYAATLLHSVHSSIYGLPANSAVMVVLAGAPPALHGDNATGMSV